MQDLRLEQHTERQHGLITRAQLLDLGSRRQVERLISTRRIVPVRRGVFRVVGTPESWEQVLMGACLAGGQTARASLRSAAAIWSLDGFRRDHLDVTVDPARRARLDGVIVHESNFDAPHHRAVREGIPVTSVARTLADLSSILPHWGVGRVVDDAVRRRLTTMAAYERVARDLTRRGRRRSTITRAVLEERSFAHDGSESDPERGIGRLLRRNGLPRPAAQFWVTTHIGKFRLDLAYPREKVAIEYDSWSHHAPRTAFDGDRRRDRALEMVGWHVLRFTSASTDVEIVESVSYHLLRRSVA